MSSFFNNLLKQKNKPTEEELIQTPDVSYFEKIKNKNTQKLEQEPQQQFDNQPEEESSIFKSIAAPLVSGFEGARKSVLAIPELIAQGGGALKNAIPEESKINIPSIYKLDKAPLSAKSPTDWWSNFVEKTEKEQPESTKNLSDLSERIGTWAPFTGPLSPVLGALEYGLEKGIEQEYGSAAAKAAPWAVAALDLIRSIKQKKVPKSETIKTLSGLTERKFSKKTNEELSKIKFTKSQKEKTTSEIKEEAKGILESIKEESIPLSKIEKEGTNLLEKAEDLYAINDAEIISNKSLKEPRISADSADGIINFINNAKQKLTKGITHLSDATKQAVTNMEDTKKSFEKLKQKPKKSNILDEFGNPIKQEAKYIKLDAENIYKQIRENNKQIKQEYNKIKGGGEFNQDIVNFNAAINEKLIQQLEKNYPESKNFVSNLKEGNKYYKAFKDSASFDKLLSSITGESGKASDIKSIFRSKGKTEELQKLVGKQNTKRIEQLSRDLDKFDSQIKKMRTSESFFNVNDMATAFFSEKLAVAKKLTQIPRWIQARYLMNPELQKKGYWVMKYLKSGDEKRFMAAFSDFDRMLKEDNNRQKEFEKSLEQ